MGAIRQWIKKEKNTMERDLYENYCRILEAELVPALGCTEPIAIAYGAAKAREVLGMFPEGVEMSCSGNIIKNVKGVTVPNSGGLKGIDVAATLGVVGGDADSRQKAGGHLGGHRGGHCPDQGPGEKRFLYLQPRGGGGKPLYCGQSVGTGAQRPGDYH